MIDPAKNLILGVEFFAVGSCRGPERLAHCRGSWRPVRFPVLAVLLRHATRGAILFDTGYAPRYFDVLRRWPYRLLGPLLNARLTPEETLPVQMRDRCRLEPEDVKVVIVSHFHLDHIAGLKDFPLAEFICTREAWGSIQGLRAGWRAMKHVFHPALLPADFEHHVHFLEDADAKSAGGLGRTWNIFGDGSMCAVALPGHAKGQIGLRFDCLGEQFFLVADACWHEAGLSESGGPHPIAEQLAWENPALGRSTRELLEKFSRDQPDVQLIPSHCPPSVSRLAARYVSHEES